MADNSTDVAGLVLAVVKSPELKLSAKGKKYLKTTGVHEEGGSKTFFDVVAFGGVALGLNSLLKKGSKMKVTGSVSQKEYQKKDGSGVGVQNSLIIREARVVTDSGVVVVDDFYEAKEPAPF